MPDQSPAYVTPPNALRVGQIVWRRSDHRQRGVVTAGPLQPGEWRFGMEFAGVGDVRIQQSPGVSTITNMYDQWDEIPPDHTTARERLLSRVHSYEVPDWLDEGDEIQEMDTPAFAWIESLIPPHVREEWENDYPCSVFELLDMLATILDRTALTGPDQEANHDH